MTMINMVLGNNRDIEENQSHVQLSDVDTIISNMKQLPDNTEKTSKYQRDIDNLAIRYGALYRGQIIDVSLQEILIICPRRRPRIEAYQGLVNELQRMGIKLRITSRKTK